MFRSHQRRFPHYSYFITAFHFILFEQKQSANRQQEICLNRYNAIFQQKTLIRLTMAIEICGVYRMARTGGGCHFSVDHHPSLSTAGARTSRTVFSENNNLLRFSLCDNIVIDTLSFLSLK